MFLYGHLSEPFEQILKAFEKKKEDTEIRYTIKLKLVLALLRAATLQIQIQTGEER